MSLQTRINIICLEISYLQVPTKSLLAISLWSFFTQCLEGGFDSGTTTTTTTTTATAATAADSDAKVSADIGRVVMFSSPPRYLHPPDTGTYRQTTALHSVRTTVVHYCTVLCTVEEKRYCAIPWRFLLVL